VFKATDTQGTLLKTLVNDYLLTWLEAFMMTLKKNTNHASSIKQNIMLLKWNRTLDLPLECTNPNTTFGSVFGGQVT
jgi:hypothetical protein